MLYDVVTDAGEASVAIGASVGTPPQPMVGRISRWWLVAALQVGEVLAVIISSCIWLGSGISEKGNRAGLLESLCFAVAVALIVHFVLRLLRAYEFAVILKMWRSGATAATAWILSTAPLLSWAIKLGQYGSLWQIHLVNWLWGGACIVLVRLGAGYAGNALLRARWLSHNVAIVGSGPEAQLCAQYLQSDLLGANMVGYIAPERSCPIGSSAEQHLNAISDIQQLVQSYGADDVIVATSKNDRGQVPDLVRDLLCLPVRVLLWPPSIGIEAEWLATSPCKVGEMPVLLASIPPLHGWRWVLKDVQDRLLAVILLIVCSPVLLAIAASIRVSSPGPTLFRQEREGYNGRNFVILKFRTMRVEPRNLDRLVLTAKQDPRIFPLGAILRKTSLDELPQLFNVLRGDMWLIGPRPHSPLATAAGQRYSAAVKQYVGRYRVKPGITGWAQVNGWRGTTNTIEDIEQRVAYDLYYIEHWSTWLDVKIVFRTAIKGFTHENAY